MWLGVVCLAGIAGCSKTPTSPTAAPAPPSAQIIIANPQQSTAASAPPRLTLAPPRAIAVTRLVAFGDSITWGAQSAYDPRFIFATASGGYPERLHAGLNAYHAPQQFVVFNEGVPGEWASDPRTLPRLRAAIVNRQAQAVLLLEGINDLSNGNGVPRTIAGLAQLVEAATSVGVPVVIATMYQTYVSTSPEGSVRTNGAS